MEVTGTPDFNYLDRWVNNLKQCRTSGLQEVAEGIRPGGHWSALILATAKGTRQLLCSTASLFSLLQQITSFLTKHGRRLYRKLHQTGSVFLLQSRLGKPQMVPHQPKRSHRLVSACTLISQGSTLAIVTWLKLWHQLRAVILLLDKLALTQWEDSPCVGSYSYGFVHPSI